MHCQYVPTFFVLYTGLFYVAVVSSSLSGKCLESYKDIEFFSAAYYGNCTGVHGESRIVENIFKDIVGGAGNG